MTDLIVMALPMEAQQSFDDLPVLYTGVGKVNATFHLTKAILQQKPSRVINLGTAGSDCFPQGTMVCCTKFLQRDMDVTPLNFAPFQTPFEDRVVLENGLPVADLPMVTCGTGDSFSMLKNDAYQVVDMEGYALAKVCQWLHIPFIAIKYISDGNDAHAPLIWEQALKDGALKLRASYNKI